MHLQPDWRVADKGADFLGRICPLHLVTHGLWYEDAAIQLV